MQVFLLIEKINNTYVELKKSTADPIDLVVVNLYPFESDIIK